jgi:hypothetical protein
MNQIGSVAYQSVIAIKDQYLLAAVAACIELADEFGPWTDLAGSWIFDRARTKIPDFWIPNFKPFVTHGILTRVGGSRGGQRAYYRLVDPEGTKRALIELGLPLQVRTAAGAS